ncbi:MAG: tryptophan 2,3-dioxygenase family protein, partial [Planctomycetota bacterium]
MANVGEVYYGEYLQLAKLLDAQHPKSAELGSEAHDETLFIITHQAYELWFKQILHELRSVLEIFAAEHVDDRQMGKVNARLERILLIQRLLLLQIDVIETMTPLDFLEFRDLLVPASGFQSIQFKEIEITLGLRRNQRLRTDQNFFLSRLSVEDQRLLADLEQQTSLLEATDHWLTRFPFLEFGQFRFWDEFKTAVNQMLDSDHEIIENNPTLDEEERRVQFAELTATRNSFDTLLDADAFLTARERGDFRLSHQAMLAALFIHLYRDEPMLYLPFRYLTNLLEIDERMTTWRTRHAMMVQRMLGTKIGTGGSSGHDYLSKTAAQNRVFTDLFTLSTFL